MSQADAHIQHVSVAHPSRVLAVVLLVAALIGGAALAQSALVGSRADSFPASFGVSVLAAPTALEMSVMALVDHGTSTSLTLLRPATGEALARIQLGFYPMAVYRASRSEILVSDVVLDSPTDPSRSHSRLFVLDAAGGLSVLRGPFTLNDRIRYTVYGQALVFSETEELLYYLKHVECGPGCDDMSVGVFDLSAGREVASASLPRNCGYAMLSRAQSGITAMCPQLRSVWKVNSSGQASQVARFAGAGWPVAGGVGASGEPYLVTQQGMLVVQRQGRDVSREILAPAERFSGAQRWHIGDGRIALAQKTSADEIMNAVLVLDTRHWTTSSHPVPAGTTFAAHQGNGRLQLLHGSRLSVLDLATGVLSSVQADAPARTEYLIGPGD